MAFSFLVGMTLQLLMEIMSVRLLLIVMLLLDGNNPFAPDYAGNYAPGNAWNNAENAGLGMMPVQLNALH